MKESHYVLLNTFFADIKYKFYNYRFSFPTIYNIWYERSYYIRYKLYIYYFDSPIQSILDIPYYIYERVKIKLIKY